MARAQKEVDGEDMFNYLYNRPPKSKEDWLRVHQIDTFELSCVPRELKKEDGCPGVMGWLKMLEEECSVSYSIENKVYYVRFGPYRVNKKYLYSYQPWNGGCCNVRLKYALEIAGGLVKKEENKKYTKIVSKCKPKNSWKKNTK